MVRFIRSLFLFVVLALVACDDITNWPRCSQMVHPDPVIQNGMSVRNIGDITIDGETCKIEEVLQYQSNVSCPEKLPCGISDNDRYGQCATDGALKCHYCGIEFYTKPLMRRMICPSGENETSTVGHDNDKFHREVLQ